MTPQILALVSLMTPQVLALVSLASPRLVVIAVAIILFRLIASVYFSFIPLVASLAPLMVMKIIITVSTVTVGVAVAVIPLLRRSDRAAGDGRKNDESYCESCRADQSGKP
ncbi:MAG TPA: hypothetical protein VE961_27955 [Pyrinomonadaceae bacterium]|nr:hypothetical protein [Pyrinomonadaceae bacterium]